MSEPFDCRSIGLFNTAEIRQYLNQWASSLSGFQSQMGRFPDLVLMEPRSLPREDALSALRISHIRVDGYPPPRGNLEQLFREIISRAEERLAISCRIGFEEINSTQTQRAYDSISIARSGKHGYFTYSANGSRVMNERGYAEAFIRDMISKVSLPVSVVAKNTDYYLSHNNASMKLMTLKGGLDGVNPCAFRCEVDWDGNTLIDKMFEILPLVATKKRFDVCWRTGKSLPYGVTEDPDGSIMEFYKRLVELDLPAEKYFIDIGFRIDNIEGLEALRQLCGPKDDCFVQVCIFKVSDREYGRIGVHTCHDGHRVTFECPMPVDIAWLNGTLGIEFEQY